MGQLADDYLEADAKRRTEVLTKMDTASEGMIHVQEQCSPRTCLKHEQPGHLSSEELFQYVHIELTSTA